MMRRVSCSAGAVPTTSVRQEWKAGWPAATFSNVLASAVIWGSISCSLASPQWTPSRTKDSIFNTPRKLGSLASEDSIGCTRMSDAVADSTSSVDSSRSPLRSKNGPPSGRRTLWKRSGLSCSAAASRWAPSSASSGVAPSTTIMVRFWSCGNAFSKTISRWRHSSFGEINLAVSAVMLKWPPR